MFNRCTLGKRVGTQGRRDQFQKTIKRKRSRSLAADRQSIASESNLGGMSLITACKSMMQNLHSNK
jgi:hypothetical protein